MGMTPEGKVKKALDAMLKGIPGLWFFPPQAGPFGSAGVPDRVVCYKGLFIGIEAKADETKKMTDLQEHSRRQILAPGGKFALVYDKLTIERLRLRIIGGQL